MSYELAEQVLRATATATIKKKEVVEDQAQELSNYASSQAAKLGNSMQANGATLLVATALAGIAISYVAVNCQLNAQRGKRLAFDKERVAGIATFTIPTNKMETALSHEERVIRDYMELMSQESNKSFASYLGVQTGSLENNKNAVLHATLPFYRLSEKLPQPLASNGLLDQVRKNIALFFTSAFPDSLANIDHDFQLGNPIVEFFESAYEQSNYLNDKAAPRFLMMSLANLLWNLQHPVDENGYPLTADECIELCYQVDVFLNEILRAGTPDIASISDDDNQLLSFVRKVKTHVNALQRAYADKQARELNLDDVADSAYRSLLLMDTNIFKLLYKRYDPVLKKSKPDSKAAADMAYKIGYLNELLVELPDLLKEFEAFSDALPATAKDNNPPQTVVDTLIIFSHLTSDDKDKLIKKLKKLKVDAALEFAHTLAVFDEKFIHPIKVLTKKHLQGKNLLWPDKQLVATTTAARFIPFMTLIIEDFGVLVDTETSLQRAKDSTILGTGDIRIYSGQEQAAAINLEAAEGKQYYKWDLPFLLQLDKASSEKLKDLPKQQYRLTQVTKLLNNFNELVQSYRGFLRHKSFQDFSKKCLEQVEREFKALLEKVKDIDQSLSHDNLMRANLKTVIEPMTRQLKKSLDAFFIASKHSMQVLQLPHFTEQERELVATKINAVHEQFDTLFDLDSGISDLIGDNDAAVVKPAVVQNSFANTNTVLELKDLVQQCHDAMSWQSQWGHKGKLLTDLLLEIKKKSNFTPAEIDEAVMRLVRVTSSYRATFFGQAAYGHTRSAKVLINAVKDKKLKNVLPLASILWQQPVANTNKFNQLNNKLIADRLTRLCAKYKWEEDVEDIEEGLVL